MIDAYALTLAAFLLTAGTVSDRVGGRFVFAVGVVIFSGGSLACSLARGRFSGGGAWRAGRRWRHHVRHHPGSARPALRGKERGITFGAFGAIAVRHHSRAVLDELIASGLSSRWIFFGDVPIGIVALLITLTRIDESRNTRPQHGDPVGFISSGGLAALLRPDPQQRSRLELGDRYRSRAAATALIAMFFVANVRRRPDVGHASDSRANLQQWPRRGLGDLGLAVFAADLPGCGSRTSLGCRPSPAAFAFCP